MLYISLVLGYDKKSAAPGWRLRNLGKKRGETMLYCAKCHGVCPDATAKCPNCKSGKLRQVDGEDLVLLHKADQYAAQRLGEEFDREGIVYEMKPFDGGRISYLYDSDVLPTDRMVLVRWKDYEAGKAVSARLKETLDEERSAGAEDFEEMPRKKRILVQIVSVFGFILLIMLVVYGADWAANWLRGLFA